MIVFSRSRTGFRKTDTILNRLIRGAIQTGLFAGIFSLGNLVSFVVLTGTNFFGMFAIPVGRIYTNVSDLNKKRLCYPLTRLPFLFFYSFMEDPLGYPPCS